MAVGPRPRAAGRQIFPARDAAHRQRPRVAVGAAEQADADERLVTRWAGRHGLRTGVEPADAAAASRGCQPGGFLEKIATGGEGDRYVAPRIRVHLPMEIPAPPRLIRTIDLKLRLDLRGARHGVKRRIKPEDRIRRERRPAPAGEWPDPLVRRRNRAAHGAHQRHRLEESALEPPRVGGPHLVARFGVEQDRADPPSGRRARRRRCSQRRPRCARCKPESDCSSPAPGSGASK